MKMKSPKPTTEVEKLVNEHYKLIGWALKKYFAPWWKDYDTLRSQAHYVIMQCANKFKPGKAKFSTYFLASLLPNLNRCIKNIMRDRSRMKNIDPFVLLDSDWSITVERTFSVVSRREYVKILKNAIQSFPKNKRDVIRLRWIKCKTIREIGKIQGCSHETIRLQLPFLLEKLKLALVKRGLKLSPEDLNPASSVREDRTTLRKVNYHAQIPSDNL